MERIIRRYLSSSEEEKAKQLIAQYLKDDNIREGSKKEIRAEFAFAMGDYPSACQLGLEALRLGGDPLCILNLVAKSLLKLNQYAKALQCFEKAHSLCPVNIERLLSIAEINLQLDHPAQAGKAIQAAAAIDPENQEVQERKCELDIEMGNLAAATKEISELESVPKVAAYINNKAVALARLGRNQDGIELYLRAIQCLENKWLELSAHVSYNLSLAYARQKSYQESIIVLTKICENQHFSIYKKAASLLRKLQNAVREGVELSFDKIQTEEAIEIEPDVSGYPSSGPILDDLVMKLTATRGEVGCYLIFHNKEGVDPRATELLSKIPRFTPRKIIDKDEKS
jgi:tetratricopeptide (TPR) repeat protein